ncbi:MAG: MopE-related protein [Pseudomonadota bacterium]|nr:MopE-related protein [Pseudomonadota bacterium]
MLLIVLAGCLINGPLYERRKEELTDDDGDSFAQDEDCNDKDAAIFPDADEICDGADQDCDGEVDEDALDALLWYPDADADTYGDASAPGVPACDTPTGHVANALDCNDGATGQSPAGAEIAYDGVDDDCDGTDLTDVDGDGHDAQVVGGDDCDDSRADLNPTETEVPYDGLDQDCQGGDADDLDGDGAAATEAGGDDCDDTVAGINPSAREAWADGFTDNDCDGENGDAVLEFGSEVWSGWRAGDRQGRRVAALGDLDGNGLQDVLIGTEYDSTLGEGSGAVYAIDGAPGGSLEVARSLLPDVAGRYFASDVDAGIDATDDGIPDLLVSTVGSAEVAGTAWIVDGSAWVVAGDATIGEVEVGFVSGSAPGTYGPASVQFVGDVTGDGVTDIALSECCGTSSGSSSRGRVAIFSADTFAGSIEDADVLIDGPWDGAYMGGELESVGDQNGDGLDDILVGGAAGLAGAIVGGSVSGSLSDLAIAMIYGDVSAGFANARNAGDLDGDGRDDVAILGEDEAGVIYLFTAVGSSPTRTIGSPSCVFDWSEHGGVFDIVPLGDRDGDGRDDLFIPEFYSDSGNQRAWILPGAAVSFGGSVEAEESSLSGVSVVPMATFGYSAALGGDVDGDGGDDIVVGAPDYSATAALAGAATLIAVPR